MTMKLSEALVNIHYSAVQLFLQFHYFAFLFFVFCKTYHTGGYTQLIFFIVSAIFWCYPLLLLSLNTLFYVFIVNVFLMF